MLRDAIRRLDEAFPRLSRWVGGRLDIQLPALGVSLLTHLLILVAFGMLGYAAHSELGREFRTELLDTALSDFATLDDRTSLADLDDTAMRTVAGSFAPEVSPLLARPPVRPPIEVQPGGEGLRASAAPRMMLERPEVALAANLMAPGAPRLDRALSLKGTGAEHVENVEGAVDRIAVEILRAMERGRTLVIWAFDASGSLQAERDRLGRYIDGVYHHVGQLDTDRLADTGGLLTAVVAFGKDRKILTPEPTADAAAISRAIAAVPLDETGIESTFRTVAEIARRWGRFKGEGGEAYRTMIVVVTDEVGDDEGVLEPAIAACLSAQVPVYVLGSPALFGRVEGFMDYTDPKTKQVYRHLPVRQGPESAMLEGVRLPFWYNGPQYEFLDAGFGPWALSRLAGATGGIYFVTRMGGERITFDPVGMREYKPDWVPREQYALAVTKRPTRLAVMKAAEICQQNLPGQPSLTFPAAESPDFKEAMRANQEVVARTLYTVNMALQPVAAAARHRDHETSRRWQAHYDLIRGRLIAIRLRCSEYNLACAKMKKTPRKFTNPAHNAWRLVPDEKELSSDRARSDAAEAHALLEQIVADHPGTPWALLAGRELKDPFGFRWDEVTVPPPPRRQEGDGGNPARRKNDPPPPKPAELPKL